MKKTMYRVLSLSLVSIAANIFYGRVLPGDLDWLEMGSRVWFTISGILLMAVGEWLNIGGWIREDE